MFWYGLGRAWGPIRTAQLWAALAARAAGAVPLWRAVRRGDRRGDLFVDRLAARATTRTEAETGVSQSPQAAAGEEREPENREGPGEIESDEKKEE